MLHGTDGFYRGQMGFTGDLQGTAWDLQGTAWDFKGQHGTLRDIMGLQGTRYMAQHVFFMAQNGGTWDIIIFLKVPIGHGNITQFLISLVMSSQISD